MHIALNRKEQNKVEIETSIDKKKLLQSNRKKIKWKDHCTNHTHPPTAPFICTHCTNCTCSLPVCMPCRGIRLCIFMHTYAISFLPGVKPLQGTYHWHWSVARDKYRGGGTAGPRYSTPCFKLGTVEET